MANETRKKLYTAINNAGFDVGNYDDFDRRMNNATDRMKFYDAVNDAGYDIGGYEDFERRIAPSKYQLRIKGKNQPVSEKQYKDFLRSHNSSAQNVVAKKQTTTTPKNTEPVSLPRSSYVTPQTKADGTPMSYLNTTVAERAEAEGSIVPKETREFVQSMVEAPRKEYERRSQPYVEMDEKIEEGYPYYLRRSVGEVEDADREKLDKWNADGAMSTIEADRLKKEGIVGAEADALSYDIAQKIQNRATGINLPVEQFPFAYQDAYIQRGKDQSPENLFDEMQKNGDFDSLVEGALFDVDAEGNKTIKQAIKNAANRNGVSLNGYVSKVVVPAIAQTVNERLYQNEVTKQLPQGYGGYLAGKLRESALGMLVDMVTKTKSQRQAGMQAMQQYENDNVGFWGKVGGAATSMIGDLPAMAVSGKVGSVVTKQVAKQAAKHGVRQAVNDFTLANIKKLGWKEGSKWLGREVALNAPGSMANLGTFSALKGVEGELYAGEDNSALNLLKVAGSEFLTGGAEMGLPMAFIQPFSKMAMGMNSVAGRVGMKAGAKSGEVLAFALPEYLHGVANGEDVKFIDSLIDSAAMVVGFGIVGHIQHGKNTIREIQGLFKGSSMNGIRLTDAEMDYLNNNVLNGKGFADYFSNAAIDVKRYQEALKKKDFKTLEELDGHRDMIAGILTNKDIPLHIRQKISVAIAGVVQASTPVYDNFEVQGKKVITRSKDGEAIGIYNFKDKEELLSIIDTETLRSKQQNAAAYLVKFGVEGDEDPEARNIFNSAIEDIKRYFAIAGDNNTARDEIIRVLTKDPARLTVEEADRIRYARERLQVAMRELSGDQKNTELAAEQGATSAENADVLGEEKPEVVQQEKEILRSANDRFTQAEEALQNVMQGNDSVRDMLDGMDNITNDVVARLTEQGVSPDNIDVVKEYISAKNNLENAKARWKAFTDGIDKSIDKLTEIHFANIAHQGEGTDGNSVVEAKDKDGKTWYVTDGNVSEDGKIESESDMVIVTDEEGEIDYKNINELTDVAVKTKEEVVEPIKEMLRQMVEEEYALNEQTDKQTNGEAKGTEPVGETPAGDNAGKPAKSEPTEGVDAQPASQEIGVFGNIYNQFRGKIKDAVSFLIGKKNGQARHVLHRDGVGDIDVVWGDKKGGLEHIIENHVIEYDDFNSIEELTDTIEDVVNNGEVYTQQNGEKVVFEKDGYRVVVAKNEAGDFVLTAFDTSRSKEQKKRSEVDATLVRQSIFNQSMEPPVRPTSNVSDGKDTTNIPDTQENREKNDVEPRNDVPTVVSTDGTAYIEAEPKSAYDDFMKRLDGDKEMTSAAIDYEVEQAQKALDKAQNKKAQGIKALQQKKADIKDAQRRLDYWNKVKELDKAERDVTEDVQPTKTTTEPVAEPITESATEDISDENKSNQSSEGEGNNSEENINIPNSSGGRLEYIKKGRNFEEQLRRAKEIYGEFFDDDWTVPQDVLELVALNMPRNINWEGINGKRGLQYHLGRDKKRGIGKGYDTNAFNAYLAKKGEGMSFDEAVHSIYESEENWMVGHDEPRWDDAEIRDALLEILLEASKPSDIRDYVIDSRARQADGMLETQLAQEELYRQWEEEDEESIRRTGLTVEEYAAWEAERDERVAAQNGYENAEQYFNDAREYYDRKAREIDAARNGRSAEEVKGQEIDKAPVEATDKPGTEGDTGRRADGVTEAPVSEQAAEMIGGGENEPQPIGSGVFGNIYDQFKGKVKEAFDFLIKNKGGDLLNVFHRDDIGDIDLVWGDKDKDMGLEHIIDKHVGHGKDFETIDDAISKINSVIENGTIIQDGAMRYVVSEDGFRVGIRKDFDGIKKNWVVTAVDYNRTKEEKGITTNPTSASHGAEGSEFAAPRNSNSKVTDNSANVQGKVKKTSSGGKIDDVGERLEGARKDALKVISKSFEDATEQALTELPFSKAFKKPDLKKAVENGVLRNEDAQFYDALFSLINTTKPKLTQREQRRKKLYPGYETDVEKWARQTHGQLEALKAFVEASPEHRDEIMRKMLEDHFPDREKELADIEQRKKWNKDYTYTDEDGKEQTHRYEWGDKTTPNPLWVTHEILSRLSYEVGSKVDIPYGIVKASSDGLSYSLESLKGEKNYGIGSFTSVEDAIDMAVYLTKMKRGDTDLQHPSRLFDVIHTKTTYKDSGKYRVLYGSKMTEKQFDSKEEADKFVEEKNVKGVSAYAYPIREVDERTDYVVTFRNPIDGKTIKIDGEVFADKAEAQAYLSANMEKINDAVNDRLREEGSLKEKKELTANDMMHVSYTYNVGEKTASYAVYVNNEIANNYGMPVMLREGFKTREEAQRFLDEHKAEVFDIYKKQEAERKAFTYFSTGEDTRIGEDYRNGKDVGAEDFMNEFGFRGVQFGNWTNQRDRQMAVNQAYDALLDMAHLIGVSPKALSLNGKLGIAFGARGGGNANAHFERDEFVINLTKTRGAGSLAHEWWHALDSYFAKQAGMELGMVTEQTSLEIRKELREAYNHLVDVVKGTDYYERSRKKGAYWGSIVEVTARLYAEWVDQSLKNRGKLNTFLSRGADTEKWQKMMYDLYKASNDVAGKESMTFDEFKETKDSLNGYPYPSAKEVGELGDAVRNIFNTVQERIDEETGNVALFHKVAEELQPTELSEREVALRDTLTDTMRNAGIDVIADEQEGQRVLDMMNVEGSTLSKAQKRAAETATLSEISDAPLTVVSTADGAKVLNNLDELAKNYGDLTKNNTKTFLGDIAKVLGAKKHGSNSQYATFETKNGQTVTIRLANHNAKVSTFDNHGEGNGISIVVSHRANQGVTNDGQAHVVEYYYPETGLRRAEGKPLADIVRAIQQSLYSGEFNDPTGLAERTEVNAEQIKMHKAYHGSGADFDAFDHSHMGEGEGAQAYGWGTYLTEVEGVGKTYARSMARKPLGARPVLYKGEDYKHANQDGWSDAKKEVFEDIIDHMRVQGRDISTAMNNVLGIINYNIELNEKGIERSKIQEKHWNDAIAFLNGMTDEQYDKLVNSGEWIGLGEELRDLKYAINDNRDLGRGGVLLVCEGEIEHIKQNRTLYAGRKAFGEQKLKALKEFNDGDFARENYEPTLYTVDIPDDNGRNYLVYDANMEQQPKLLEAISKGLESLGWRRNGMTWSNDTHRVGFELAPYKKGGKIYETLSKMLGSDKAASEFLHSIGVTGIKYPAEYRSGGREDNAKNYVIFNEEDAKITEKVKFFRTRDGKAFGYTMGGKIYIDPHIATSETPVHEYTHLWAEAVRKGKPEKWEEIKSVLLNDEAVKPFIDKVRKEYKDIKDEDELLDEVLAQYSGKRGAERLRKVAEEIAGENPTLDAKALATAAMAKVKSVLEKYWRSVAEVFGWKYTNSDEIADKVLSDLLEGRNPVKDIEKDNRLREQKSFEADSKERSVEELFNELHKTTDEHEYSERVNDIVQRGGVRGKLGKSEQGRIGKVSRAIEVIATDNGEVFRTGTENGGVSAYKERQRKHAQQLIDDLGGNGKVVGSETELDAAGKSALRQNPRATGWYNPETSEVTVYLPNCHSDYEAQRTVMHEKVGHEGLRRLMGEDGYKKFLQKVWMELDGGVRAELTKRFGMDYKTAVDEYLAEKAEVFDDADHSLWQKVKDTWNEVMTSIGFKQSSTENDIRTALWLSKNRLQNKKGNVEYRIRKAAFEYRLQKESLPERTFEDNMSWSERVKDARNEGIPVQYEGLQEVKPNGQFMFRTMNDKDREAIERGLTPAGRSAKHIYEHKLKSTFYIWQEGLQDNMKPLDVMQNAICGEGKVKDSENAWMAMNRLGSVIQQELEKFDREHIAPLQDALTKALPFFEGKTAKERYRALEDYLIAKHGLERNRVLFVRDALAESLKSDDANIKADAKAKQADFAMEFARLSTELRRGRINLADFFAQLDDYIKTEISSDFEAGKGDMSGLSDAKRFSLWTGATSGEYDDAAVIDYVMDCESKMGDAKANELQGAIRRMSQYEIEKRYQSGLISKAVKERMESMFNWYVPLRGFDEQTAEETWTYIDGIGVNNSARMDVKTLGRISASRSPLATLQQLCEYAISRGNENVAKQHLYRLVLNNPNDLATITDSVAYLRTVRNGQTVLEAIYPDLNPHNMGQKNETPLTADEIGQRIEQWKQDIKLRKQKGEDIISLKDMKGDVPYRIVNAGNKPQHIVEVRIAGVTKHVMIQSHPRAAQAINGMLRDSGGAKWIKKFNSTMSQLCTSRSLSFMATNAIRDAGYALNSLLVTESSSYIKDFVATYSALGGKALPNIAFNVAGMMPKVNVSNGKKLNSMRTLFAKMREGTLDKTNETERYFDEFVRNGAITGYVQMKGLDQLEKQWNKSIEAAFDDKGKIRKTGDKIWSGVKKYFKFVEGLNESVENQTRFAAYVASRKAGRTISRSVNDAKNISVNFNITGSGDAVKTMHYGEESLWHEINRQFVRILSYGGKNYLWFFNAGVQGFARHWKMFMNGDAKQKAKWIATMNAVPMSIGYALPYISGLIASQIDSDEDKKKYGENPYLELPDYERRSNICIYIGHGRFIKMPMAIEGRVPLAMGDILHGLMHEPKLLGGKNVYGQFVEATTQALPIDFGGGSKVIYNDWRGSVLGSVTPSGVQPILQNMSNIKWTGARIANENQWNEHKPEWTKASASTSQILVDFTGWLNTMTGGDEIMPGAIDLSPGKIQNLLEGYTGGVGKELVMLISAAVEKYNDEDINLSRFPVTKGVFTDNVTENALRNEQSIYYSRQGEYNDILNYIRDYIKLGNTVKSSALKNSPKGMIAEVYDFYGPIINDIRKRKNQATTRADKEALITLEREKMKECNELADLALSGKNAEWKKRMDALNAEKEREKEEKKLQKSFSLDLKL